MSRSLCLSLFTTPTLLTADSAWLLLFRSIATLRTVNAIGVWQAYRWPQTSRVDGVRLQPVQERGSDCAGPRAPKRKASEGTQQMPTRSLGECLHRGPDNERFPARAETRSTACARR